MIDAKAVELIHREIDGVITPSERELLDRHLEQDSHLHMLHRQLIQASDLIEDITPIEPSPRLKQNVMAAIDFNKMGLKSSNKNLFSIPGQWFSFPRKRIAYAFALGMIVSAFIATVLLYNYDQNRDLDPSKLSATIGLTGSKNFRIIESQKLKLPEAEGVIFLKRSDQFISLELNLFTGNDVEIVLNSVHESLPLHHFEPLDNKNIVFERHLNSATILAGEGNMKAILYYTHPTVKSVSLTLNLIRSGELLFTHTFLVNSENN